MDIRGKAVAAAVRKPTSTRAVVAAVAAVAAAGAGPPGRMAARASA
jgi:hypothetical protein